MEERETRTPTMDSTEEWPGGLQFQLKKCFKMFDGPHFNQFHHLHHPFFFKIENQCQKLSQAKNIQIPRAARMPWQTLGKIL